MKIKCGSCGSEYGELLAECDNCGFPNRKFMTPLKATTEIEIEADLIRSMEEHCKRTGVKISDAWTEAVEMFLIAINKRDRMKRASH